VAAPRRHLQGPAASDASSSHRARWCRCRRRQVRRYLCSCAIGSAPPPLPSLPRHLQLTGGWRSPPFAGAGGGRYLIYRPGWTVFHLPSTPWALESRPTRILRSRLKVGKRDTNRGAASLRLKAGNSPQHSTPATERRGRPESTGDGDGDGELR
jgi:hypothetical protein